MAIKNNILAVGCLAMLMLSACTADIDPAAEQEIALTTPVVELDGVEASASRGVSTVSKARLSVALYDNDNRVYNENREATYILNGTWSTEGSPLTVTGGEGHYRAGLSGTVSIDGSPAIADAFYAYRGSIGVQANGNFTPDAALSAYSAAVLVNLKDANGTPITSGSYRINPVGLAKMDGFAGGADAFPHGTGEAVYSAADHPAYMWSTTTAQGDFCPGTYPATWTNGELQAGAQTEWPIFEVTYSTAGFNNDGTPVDGGNVTTWNVNYTGQLTLDKGKLYAFTITLSFTKATITLDTPDGKPGWATNVQEHEFDNSPNDLFKAAMNELRFVNVSNNIGTFEVSGPNGLMVLNKWMTSNSISWEKLKSLGFVGANNIDSYVNSNKLKQNIKLMVDITLPDVGTNESNWNPIAPLISDCYRGTFDGNGKTLTNLTINSTSDRVGLIGCMSDNGKVKNLTLSNVKVKGNEWVGSIAGCKIGSSEIDNCTVLSGKVEGITKVGGIVGTSDNVNGSSKNCTNKADVTGYVFVGGIVGENDSPITNCTNYGSVNVPTNINGSVSSSIETQDVGGIIGYNTAKISGCTNHGLVKVLKGYNSCPSYIGGIVGRHDNTTTTVEGCFNFADVKKTYSGSNSCDAGGVIGILNKGTCVASGNSGTLDIINGTLNVGGIIGNLGGKVYGCWTTNTVKKNLNLINSTIGKQNNNTISECYVAADQSDINGKVNDMNTAISTRSTWKWEAGVNSATDWPTLVKNN
ncbi:MAG: hypothetical protein IKU64_04205 [Bacteroides sp.]|nr:hypothetical protein [Bacteroides sp.]